MPKVAPEAAKRAKKRREQQIAAIRGIEEEYDSNEEGYSSQMCMLFICFGIESC